MASTKCDSKGRLYLREGTRKRYGDEFVVVEASDQIILIPVPADPLAELARIGRKLKGKSSEDIKNAIRKRAEEEALS